MTGFDIAPGETLAVAVSGGPDSLALLLLAHAALGQRVCVLTVDHGLRAESASEAAMVAAHAAELGLPHVTLQWDGPHPRANLQAAARVARYRLLGDWCADNGVAWLATGHHADDAAETLLLRLARGSGAGGLGGIRVRRQLRPGVTLIRPLLGHSKADLARIVADAGWTAVDDPSNRSPRFDRTRARALLAATPWLAPERLAASAAHLAQAEAALDWTAGLAWASRAEASAGAVTLDVEGLPREVVRRLVLRAIVQFASFEPRGPTLDRLLARLAAGGGGTVAGVAVRGSDSGIGVRWRFAKAPRRR